ncbi:MAG TPA: VWA domain-containing protein [Bryobacteraceae bacterium]|jgi:VWFA-related protein
MRLRWALVFVAIACAGAQEASTVFKVTAPLVLVPATVTDKTGKTIDGLTESDFQLLDNGVPQKPSMEYTLSPISLVLVIEANGRSGAVLRKIQKIGSLIQPLVLGERGAAAVVTFADEARVWQDFTSKPEILGNCLKKIEPQGEGVRMHDAISKAVDMLVARNDRAQRRVVLVVSESKDHGSKMKFTELVTKAQAANVIIYPMTYSVYATAFTSKGAETFDSGKPVYDADSGGLIAIFTELAAASHENSHVALAKYTGGEQLHFTRLEGLERVVQKIGEDLHSQYLLSFSPSTSGAAAVDFHKLEVRVKGHPEALIRTRPGYWPAVARN